MAQHRTYPEWLALAHGTRYELKHEPFVAFDLIIGVERTIYQEFADELSLIYLKSYDYSNHLQHRNVSRLP